MIRPRNLVRPAGGREMVTQAEAERLMQIIVGKEGYLPFEVDELSLSNKSYTFDAAVVFSNEIRKYTNLSEVDASDIIAGRPEDEAVNVLGVLFNSLATKPILRLHISDNALGDKGIEVMTSSISTMRHLQLISVNNDGMSANATCMLVSALIQANSPHSTTNLTCIEFKNNMSGDEGAVALSRLVSSSPLLSSFYFGTTRASYAACREIVLALSGISNLTILDLSDCSLLTQDEELMPELITLLHHSTQLTKLSLSFNSLNSSHVCVVLNSLSADLNELDVSNNEVNDMVELNGLIHPFHVNLLDLRDNELNDEVKLKMANVDVIVTSSEDDDLNDELNETKIG